MSPSQILLVLALVALSVAGYPRLHTCSNFASWSSGETCNLGGPSCMGVTRYSDGSSGGCTITAPATYNPCSTYSITITSSVSRGHKIASSAGVLSGSKATGSGASSDTCRHTDDAVKQTQSKFLWRAPSGNTSSTPALISALCGDQFGGVFAATRVASAMNATATNLFPSGCPSACAGPGCESSSSQVLVSFAVAMTTMVLSALALFA